MWKYDPNPMFVVLSCAHWQNKHTQGKKEQRIFHFKSWLPFFCLVLWQTLKYGTK